mgnify:CR=1 FL=1
MKKKSFFIAIILILTVIMLTGCKNNNIDSLKLEINKIFEYAHLYLSNGDTILLYVENYENDRDTEKLSQIMDLLKSSIEKGKFNKFKKLEVITYLSENELMIKDIYNLPEFDKEYHKSYVDFEKYTELYNDYMDGTELLNEFIGL